jgi:hypothetical protein
MKRRIIIIGGEGGGGAEEEEEVELRRRIGKGRLLFCKSVCISPMADVVTRTHIVNTSTDPAMSMT